MDPEINLQDLHPKKRWKSEMYAAFVLAQQENNLQLPAEGSPSIEEDVNILDDNPRLAVYTPADAAASDGTVTQPPQDQACQIAPSVEAYTVQCSLCFKWRLIPSKEKYEEIREHLLEQPFVCRALHQWRPQISCSDDADLKPDGSTLWAIDKPNIPRPPPGWERILKIRGSRETRFADVYYYTPLHKRLRSTAEVQRYLREHPNVADGVDLSQFSFQIPMPLQEGKLTQCLFSPSEMPQDE